MSAIAIQEIYIALLGRAADKAGLEYWTNEVAEGTLTLDQIRANIVNEQPEWATLTATETRAETITRLYDNLFGRTPDANGFAYWLDPANGSLDDLPRALTTPAALSAADSAVLSNKSTAAQYFTENMEEVDAEDADAFATYLERAEAAVSDVTDADSLNASKDAVDAIASPETFVALAERYTTERAAVVDASADTSTLELATAYETAATTASETAQELAELAQTDEETATATAAQNESALSLELAYAAVFTQTNADYNESVVTADASIAAATTASETVETVEQATAYQTAANAAKTAADASVALAAAVVAAAANTPSVADDTIGSTATTAAAANQVLADAHVVDAAADVAAAEAAEAAGAEVGSTFTLTTDDDTLFGTSKSDTFNATQLTYEANDMIADSSVVDNDTLNVTATSDVSATPTVIGVENVNFNLDAVDAGGNAVFTVDAANISAGTVTLAVTKAVNAVTTADVDNVKSGMTVATGLGTMQLAGVANADLALNMTKATGAVTVTSVTGTTDDLTINSSTTGLTTITDADAEEDIVINAEGAVTVTDLSAATDTSSTLVITAKGAVIITDSNNIGSAAVETTTGNITVGGTDFDATTTGSFTTLNGDVTITNADDLVTSLTISATGDADANVTGADGDVTVTTADAALIADITASGGIDVDGLEAAKTITLSAGQASTLDGVAAVETLNLASTSTSSSALTYTVGTGSDELNAIKNINFTGSNDVTLVVDMSDLNAAKAANSAAVIATDSSSATSRIRIMEDIAATAVDATALAVDEIELGADNTITGSITLASGANLVIGADQTALILTAAAVAGNTLTITVDDDSSSTDTNSYDVAALTTSNFSTVNMVLNDTEEAVAMDTINVNAANDVVVTGAGDLTVGTSVTAKTFDASGSTGIMTIDMLNTVSTVYKTGSGDDIFNASTTAGALTVDGGGGVDTVVFAVGADDWSAQTVSFTNIEKLDVTAVNGIETFSGAQMTGKGYAVIGDAAADTLAVVTGDGGETVDLSGFSTSVATLTLTGGTGADVLTGSSTTATTISAGTGNDLITGGAAADTITSGGGADVITGGAGRDTITVDTDTGGTRNVVTITDFAGGGSTGDLLKVSLADLESHANVTQLIDGNSAAITAGSLTVKEVTSDTTAAAGQELFVLVGATFADTDAVEAALETGDFEITLGSAPTAKDAIMIVYSDGTDAYFATAATDTTNANLAETDLTVQNAVKFTGIASIAAGDFATANFELIA